MTDGSSNGSRRQSLHIESDPDILDVYSTDESVFKWMPEGVIKPGNADDVSQVIESAKKAKKVVTARGGGTSACGQALGGGWIVDMSGFQGLEWVDDHTVRAGVGVTLEQFNTFAGKKGMRFAPNPGSHKRCTIGGIVSTNASGPRSLAYGCTRDHTVDVLAVDSWGKLNWVSQWSDRSAFQNLCSDLEASVDLYRDKTRAWLKNSSGYHLSALDKEHPNPCGLYVGSEGSLGVSVAVKLNVQKVPKERTLMILPCASRVDACDMALDFRQWGPVAIELVDRNISLALHQIHSDRAQALGLSKDAPSLWIEWEGPLPQGLVCPKQAAVFDQVGAVENAWALRSEASTSLHAQASTHKPLRCIEDAVLPLTSLRAFMVDVEQLLEAHGLDAAIFGHIGQGHLHINPKFDIHGSGVKERVLDLVEAFHHLVLNLGGSISGEHGDGLLRGADLGLQWGGLLESFAQVKATLDPDGVFPILGKNPNKDLRKDISIRNLNNI